MEYASIKDMALEWDLSEKRIQVLCSDNRILGAQKVGNTWIIPKGTKKPIDNRIKNQNIIDLHDVQAIVELITEDSKISKEFDVEFQIKKDNMLRPHYGLKLIYTDTFILDKYYNTGLTICLGKDIDNIEVYLANIETKINLIRTEPKTEINKFILKCAEMIKNVLELIMNQRDNLGFATNQAQNKFNKEHTKLLYEVLEIILEYHEDDFKNLFDEFMKMFKEEDKNGENK